MDGRSNAISSSDAAIQYIFFASTIDLSKTGYTVSKISTPGNVFAPTYVQSISKYGLFKIIKDKPYVLYNMGVIPDPTSGGTTSYKAYNAWNITKEQLFDLIKQSVQKMQLDDGIYSFSGVMTNKDNVGRRRYGVVLNIKIQNNTMVSLENLPTLYTEYRNPSDADFLNALCIYNITNIQPI